MKIGKFQEGGVAPAPAEGGQDPAAQLLQSAQMAVENQDGNMALQVCQALLQMAGGQMMKNGGLFGRKPVVFKRGGKIFAISSK